MKIVETMPFAADLLAPTYEESFRREGVVAGSGEVSLGADWALRVDDTAPTVQVAADYLRQNVITSLGGELGCGEASHEIVLRVETSLDENPETHQLTVTSEQVTVTGAGPQGVLQGCMRLVKLMRERGAAILPSGEERRSPLFKHRIHRSPLSPFYKEEMSGSYADPFNAEWIAPGMSYPGWTESDAGPDMFYHENMLLRLAEHGFNGIWIRGSFRHFARVSVFPEFGTESDLILSRLQKVAQRAARYGIQVFLYLNEPLGMSASDEFFTKYPQCAGAPSRFEPMVNLCSSSSEVKIYLRESAEYIFRQVPELAGFVMITASEYPSHCWCRSKYSPDDEQAASGEVQACPRCRERTPHETVAEVVDLIRQGAQAVKPEAEIIAWNWSWAMWEPDPQAGVLEALPPEVIVMGDYERGEPTEARGFAYTNDEYNLKVVGPSQRFRGVADFQLSRGRPVYARIQIGTTHENPVVPYLPVAQKIAQKYHTMHETGVSALMTCWNFGNMPSLGTEIAGEFSFGPQATVDEGLLAIASRHFGQAVAADVVQAWQLMSEAHDNFPGSIPVMYTGPISRGPAFYLLFDQVNKPFPHSWLFVKDVEGDQFGWASPFGPEKVLECFRAEVEGGEKALGVLKEALGKVTGEDRRRLVKETGLMEFHLVQTECAANVTEFLLLRNAYYEASDPAEKIRLLDQIEKICHDERATAQRALPLLAADARLGWHGEAYGYMISPELIAEKLARLEALIEERLPAERARLQ
jgi:hypothetical protein